jgi:hypothetical protein
MNEKEYAELVGRILAPLNPTIDEVKRSLFARDKKRLSQAHKTFSVALGESLPLFEEAASKPTKTPHDEKVMALLAPLQRIGIGVNELLQAVRTTLETDIPFTDKALTEISEIMGLVKDLSRDTLDLVSTGNPHFREYVLSQARSALGRLEEMRLEHNQRLIAGVCSPKASFLYLDIMHSLKGIGTGLVYLADKA